MKNKLNMLALLICGSLAFYSCESADNGTVQQTKVEEQKAVVQAPAFDADSAYALIEKQVAFGPRVPNTAAHYATGEWIVATMRCWSRPIAR